MPPTPLLVLYILNGPIGTSRTGYFVWDMNDAKVEVTPAETYSDVGPDQGMIGVHQTNLKILNGEFDGNNEVQMFYGMGEWKDTILRTFGYMTWKTNQ